MPGAIDDDLGHDRRDNQEYLSPERRHDSRLATWGKIKGMI